MNINRRSMMLAGVAAIAMGTDAGAQTAPPVSSHGLPSGLPEPTVTIDLWPGGAPGAPLTPLLETVNERSTDPQITDRAVFGISQPRMVVYRPDRPNGAAVLIMPGGGYRWVVIDKEGYEIARWLGVRGFTVFVLFYRLPGEGWADGPDVVLADAQRAIRTIRARASDFAIDPARVAAMGFSAGGHVCADLAARFATPIGEPTDAIDLLSARPHCAAMIYPVVSMAVPVAHAGSRALLLGPDPTPAQEAAHSPDQNVPENAPPHFIVHAQDDDVVPVANALLLRAALMARNIPVEMHLFQHGGHGFGLRRAIGKPVEIWPDLFRAWARAIGLA